MLLRHRLSSSRHRQQHWWQQLQQYEWRCDSGSGSGCDGKHNNMRRKNEWQPQMRMLPKRGANIKDKPLKTNVFLPELEVQHDSIITGAATTDSHIWCLHADGHNLELTQLGHASSYGLPSWW